jgi:hypothetical protein
MLVFTAAKRTDIRELVFTPDGTALCASPSETGPQLWDLVSGQESTRAQKRLENKDFVWRTEIGGVVGGTGAEAAGDPDRAAGP